MSVPTIPCGRRDPHPAHKGYNKGARDASALPDYLCPGYLAPDHPAEDALVVTVRADDLRVVLKCADYMEGRSLIGPVDRIADALALVQTRADLTPEDAREIGGDENLPLAIVHADPVSELHMPSYEVGYKDGESNREADLQAAITELTSWPDDRPVTAIAVAQYVAELQRAAPESEAR